LVGRPGGGFTGRSVSPGAPTDLGGWWGGPGGGAGWPRRGAPVNAPGGVLGWVPFRPGGSGGRRPAAGPPWRAAPFGPGAPEPGAPAPGTAEPGTAEPGTAEPGTEGGRPAGAGLAGPAADGLPGPAGPGPPGPRRRPGGGGGAGRAGAGSNSDVPVGADGSARGAWFGTFGALGDPGAWCRPAGPGGPGGPACAPDTRGASHLMLRERQRPAAGSGCGARSVGSTGRRTAAMRGDSQTHPFGRRFWSRSVDISAAPTTHGESSRHFHRVASRSIIANPPGGG
jgi:hypothetical protein